MITKLKENLKKAVLFLSLFTIGLYIFFSLFSHNNNDNNFLVLTLQHYNTKTTLVILDHLFHHL